LTGTEPGGVVDFEDSGAVGLNIRETLANRVTLGLIIHKSVGGVGVGEKVPFATDAVRNRRNKP